MSSLKPNSLVRNAPSPTPSTASANSNKRKRPDEVYSQPRDSETRAHELTQLTYAIDYLKNDPDKWYTFKDIMDYLNIKEDQTDLRNRLRRYFRHDAPGKSIEFNPTTGMYRYKPKYDIRNASQLKGYLQNQKSAQGLLVKDLKDGWANVVKDLEGLEAEKQVLVKRNPKDQQPKIVWNNDPTLMHDVDPEFKTEWHSVRIPASVDDMRKTLLAAKLKPSSEPKVVAPTKPKDSGRKKPRRNGKVTNSHMAGILKDFSQMRK